MHERKQRNLWELFSHIFTYIDVPRNITGVENYSGCKAGKLHPLFDIQKRGEFGMNGEIKRAYGKGFTPIGNPVFTTGLSLKARGLLCTMLSLPKNWHYSVPGLAKICGEGKDSIRKGLDELKEKGFLKMEQTRDNGKISGMHWIISDSPMEAWQPETENPTVEEKTAQPESEKSEDGKKTQYSKYRDNKHRHNNTPYIPQRGNEGGEKPDTQRTSRKQQQEKQKQEAQLVQGLFHLYSNGNNTTFKQLNEWLDVTKAKRASLPIVSIRKNLEQLPSVAAQSGLDVNSYLTQVIMRGWSGFFPVPNMGQVWGQRFGEGEPLKSSTYSGNLRRTKPLCFDFVEG